MRILITIGALILFLAGPLYAQEKKESDVERKEKSISPPKEKSGIVDLLTGKETPRNKPHDSGNGNARKYQSIEKSPTAKGAELDYLDEDLEQ